MPKKPLPWLSNPKRPKTPTKKKKYPPDHRENHDLTGAGEEPALLKIGGKVRELREEREMTQGALAELAGGSNQSWTSRVESGRIDLRMSKLLLLAKALKVKPAVLLG